MSGDTTTSTPVLSSHAPLPAAPAALSSATNTLTVTPPSPTVSTSESTPSSASPRSDISAEKDVVADMQVVQPISVDARMEGRYNLDTPVSQDGGSGPDSEQGDTGQEKDKGNEADEKISVDSKTELLEDKGVTHEGETVEKVPIAESNVKVNEKKILPKIKIEVDENNTLPEPKVEAKEEKSLSESKHEVKEEKAALVEDATNSPATLRVSDDPQEREKEKLKGIEKNEIAIDAQDDEKRGEKRVGPDQKQHASSEPGPRDVPDGEESPAKKRKTDFSGAADGNTESKALKPETPLISQPAPSTLPVAGSAATSKGNDNGKAPKKVGASVGSGMQLMLRSSPVVVDVNSAAGESTTRRVSGSRGSNVSGVTEKGDSDLSSAAPVASAQKASAAAPKKKKSVSWAVEEKLVDVKFIDSRLELLRSWDPESEITIPFSPAQVHLLRTEEQNRADAERAGQSNGGQSGSKKLTSFEAARKKEHDMELERAKQAREELQRKLDNMHPARPWEHPAEIILPAECRIDPDSVEGYSLVEEGYRANLRKRDPNSATPPSPPPELQSPRDEMIRCEADIPTFPLCDGAAPEVGEVPDSSQGSGARSEGRHDGVMHQRYDDSMGNHRMMGGAEGRLLDGSHSNLHEAGFRMDPHDRVDPGAEPGMTPNRQLERMGERSERPHHPDKLQHILSKLRSSGLFNQNSGPPNGVMDNPEEYTEGGRPEELDARGGMYEDQHGRSGRGRGRNEGRYHPNGGYPEDDRHGQGMDDRMGAGPGMGIGNGGMGPPQPPFGHPGQMPPGFPQHVQQGGMIDGFPFMAPIPPPPMGIGPNMLPMGMGMPMPPPMGMPMPFGMGPGPVPMGNTKKGGKGGKSSGNSNRVETITRPKSKGSKQRKRCKYFGTKQGCRDGASCVFAHN